MTGNRAGSPWTSTPRSRRARPGVQLTLSREAIEALEELAEGGSKSALVERLIIEARREAKRSRRP